MVNLIFASLNEVFLTEIRQRFGSTVTIHSGDVALLANLKQTAFVSPANALGFMDGGIDKVYSQVMFPSVEQAVKMRIRKLGHLDFIERPHLPIGSAIIVPADLGKSQWLVSAPTMLLPQPVPKTRNAFWATLATLRLVHKFTRAAHKRTGKILIKNIIFTSACCGYGAMDEAESARQIHEAWNEFIHTPYLRGGLVDVYFDDPCLDEQPDLYENFDFKRQAEQQSVVYKVIRV